MRSLHSQQQQLIHLRHQRRRSIRIGMQISSDITNRTAPIPRFRPKKLEFQVKRAERGGDMEHLGAHLP